MSVIFKAKLKSAKTAVAEKDYDYAYDLCHDLLELDADNYNVHILLGVSCQHMSKWSEGERVYQRAMEMPKANILAWQGICALYDSSKEPEKYEQALGALRQRYMDDGNQEKAWETMHKIIEQREASGDQRRLVRTLRELTRTGQFHNLLEAAGTDPAPPTEYELLARMYEIESALDERTIVGEISKRKTRLGAGPISKVRQEVRKEVFGESGLLETLEQQILLCTGSNKTEEVQKLKERYFEALVDRVDVMEQVQKQKVVDRLQQIARDLASCDRCAAAFEFLIETTDARDGGVRLADLADRYIDKFSNGRLQQAVQAWSALEKGEASDSVADAAREGAQKATDSPFAHVQAVRAALRSRQYQATVDAAIAARQAVQQFQDKFGSDLGHMQRALDMGAAEAYLRIGAEHASDAEHLYRKCVEADDDDTEAKLGLGLAMCTLGSTDEGQKMLERLIEADPKNHLALGGLGAARMDAGDAQSAVDYLQQAVDIEPGHAAHHARLGSAYWQLGGQWRSDRQYAYTSWLRAARLDAGIAEVFSGLGLWYQQYGNDTERAKKCLAKCMALDNTNGVAGAALADMYLAEGSDDLCEALLVRATDTSYGLRWAWRRLGFLWLRQGRGEQAVAAFQSALSGDRGDARCWEGLCEAYQSIGRMHTSVKVAQRVVELEPQGVAGYWLCAQTSMRARCVEDALRYFAQAAERVDGAAAEALWGRALGAGRAECLIACAEKWHAEGLIGRVAEAGNDALAAALALLEEDPAQTTHLLWSIVHAACIWLLRVQALFEDHPGLIAAITVGGLAEQARQTQINSSIPGFLAQTLRTAAEETQTYEPYGGHVQQLLELAALAAQRRIVTAPTTGLASAAWVDLGHAYYEHSTRLRSVALLDDAELQDESVGHARQPLLEAAADCAAAAIRLESDSARAHTLQGVVAAQRRQAALAQHAFIMATRHAPQSGIPWADLGFLYLQHSDAELANKAFSRAQMLDPGLVAGWLGQALVAEKLDSTECAELFEACVLLDGVSSAAADFGYAAHIWKATVTRAESHNTAQPRSEQSRLALAIYAARRLVARTEDICGAAHHLLGMLLELNGEYDAAAIAYSAAWTRVERGGSREWTALVSLGRAQCSAALYEDSVKTYAQAEELQPADAETAQRLFAAMGCGLALFFAGCLEESLQRFELALALSDAGDQRAFVAVVVAQVLWALGADEHRALARQHLLDAMADRPTVPGLAALFAIGLLLDDVDLVAAARTELLCQSPADAALHSTARLESCLAVLRNDHPAARRALARALHCEPSDASLWLLLADFETLLARPASAATAAAAALALVRQASRGHHSWAAAPPRALLNSASLRVLVSALEIESRALAASGAAPSAVRSAARRAVIYQPWAEDTWTCLAL
ncbi:Superkiller protein 3 [Coemansia sp. RSA 988]|nr:Superkiller protein 3 [Coemansia sp. RSA 988]